MAEEPDDVGVTERCAFRDDGRISHPGAGSRPGLTRHALASERAQRVAEPRVHDERPFYQAPLESGVVYDEMTVAIGTPSLLFRLQRADVLAERLVAAGAPRSEERRVGKECRL